jgi:hypothetical protein
MARVFTTRFAFNHQMYDAIVTVISRQGQLNFNIKVMDTELAQLLPDGHLNYSGKDGFKEIIPDNQLAETLIKSIAVSIEQHLTILP